MKKLVFLFVLYIIGTAVLAQNQMLIHTPGETIQMLVTETDSLFFSDDTSTMYLSVGGALSEYPIAYIDNITFTATTDSTIYIDYRE